VFLNNKDSNLVYLKLPLGVGVKLLILFNISMPPLRCADKIDDVSDLALASTAGRTKMPTTEKKPVIEHSYYNRFVGFLYVTLFAVALASLWGLAAGILIKPLVQAIFFNVHETAVFQPIIAICVFLISFCWIAKEVPSILRGTYRYQSYFELGKGSKHWTGEDRFK
jgi:hypothetical protein